MLIIIGVLAGLFGGLLGIGGSMVMIPAMVLCFGENQHLYQAAAMVCNVFVAGVSLIAHRKAKVIIPGILKFMVPLQICGIILGVYLSNTAMFRGEKSYLLAKCFGVFLIYVTVYNFVKLVRKKVVGASGEEREYPKLVSMGMGLVAGTGAGLLGIGAGGILTPLQQLLLKVPIKRAMANSAVTIACVAWVGATFKVVTIGKHGLAVVEPLKIAAVIIPAAMIGAYVGSHAMHALPKNVVRGTFVVITGLAAIRMLTISG